jgi:pimeloyl-ACP methyl ester carboxylesterase
MARQLDPLVRRTGALDSFRAMPIELTVDVTEAVGLGEPLHTKVTAVLPEPGTLADPPVVCFGFPGGGYSRGYFTFDMPGAAGGGEAGWHAARGWVFVACDHLCVGESDAPDDPTNVTFEHLAAANHATVTEVLRLLAAGAVADGIPPLGDATVLGIGQSMGGCLTIVQQGQHHTYDGVGILGFSAIHTVLWMPPSAPEPEVAFVPRGADVVVIGPTEAVELTPQFALDDSGLPGVTPGFHYDDVPRAIVEADMVEWPARGGRVPPWASATVPPCAITMMSPGVVAPEAAVINVPVFVGVGERDVVPDPRAEPRAYQHSPDVTVSICPRMAHMHNMASTRERLWQRLHSWGTGVAANGTSRSSF